MSLLWLVPILPLAGFAILALSGRRLSRRAVSAVALGSVGTSTVVAILVGVAFLGSPPSGAAYAQTLWLWMQVGDFAPAAAFHLDALSLTMMGVVTFVGSMLVLILADNLLLLYLGWEGVGLCSYLLIGFWYKERENVRAAMKAFFVTRIGDAAFAVGIFLLFTSFGTLQIQPLLRAISTQPGEVRLFTAAAALLAAGLAVATMSYGYLKRRNVIREEFYVLLLIALLGCAVLVSSVHFASLFIGLELLTVSLYILVAYCRSRQTDVEAGIKYFIPAAMSSAFLLFGMALVYAQTGTMSLPGLARSADASSGPSHLLVLLGAGMMLTAIGFKLALAPFHLWAADVYEGSPAPVTALIASASKGAVFVLLFRCFGAMHIQARESFFVVFTLVAILTMFLGSFLALQQNNLKRLLAYSSIAHMGYLLIAFLADSQSAETAAMFYLLAYFVTILGAVLALTMFSLAGIPLTAGFLGKFYVVLAGAQSRLWWLIFALVANSVLGLFYYLRVVIAIFEPVPYGSRGVASVHPHTHPRSLLTAASLAVLAALLIGVGVYPGPAIQLIESLRSTLR